VVTRRAHDQRPFIEAPAGSLELTEVLWVSRLGPGYYAARNIRKRFGQACPRSLENINGFVKAAPGLHGIYHGLNLVETINGRICITHEIEHMYKGIWRRQLGSLINQY
jgi:hypothetical protein